MRMALLRQPGARVVSGSLRRVLVGAAVCLLLSAVRVTDSQDSSSGSFADSVEDNDSNVTNQTVVCPSNEPCAELIANCITCEFNTSCTYGNDTEVVCHPLSSVNCTGDRTFTRTFNCRFCYQLPDDLRCCETSDSCRVRGTPNSRYLANCRARDEVLCIEPRQFQRMVTCNYSTGKRWTTAFLLSVTLGGFGVDRFYLEHWGAAVGKLVSFGGLGVWSILDVILVATGFLGPADGSAYIY